MNRGYITIAQSLHRDPVASVEVRGADLSPTPTVARSPVRRGFEMGPREGEGLGKSRDSRLGDSRKRLHWANK